MTAATGASIADAALETAAPILIGADGMRYYGGKDALHVVEPGGRRIDWTLPARASGPGPVTLIQTRDRALFLFNRPGRVARIVPTPKLAQPFALEAIFTARIPKVPTTRIWLDPADRIDIVYGGSKLVVLFPAGHIPDEISHIMVDDNMMDEEGQ
jgi:hypothetical protein